MEWLCERMSQFACIGPLDVSIQLPAATLKGPRSPSTAYLSPLSPPPRGNSICSGPEHLQQGDRTATGMFHRGLAIRTGASDMQTGPELRGTARPPRILGACAFSLPPARQCTLPPTGPRHVQSYPGGWPAIEVSAEPTRRTPGSSRYKDKLSAATISHT